MARRFRVRVTLSDGTRLNGGGFRFADSAVAEARHWAGDEVARSRAANGAAAVRSPHVLDPTDAVVAVFGADLETRRPGGGDPGRQPGRWVVGSGL